MEQFRYLTGGLNLDDSVEVMSPEDYVYMKNLVHGRSTAGGKVGLIETIKGTTSITMGSLTDANSVCIGIAISRKDSAAYLFFYNTNSAKHCILKYDGSSVTNVITWSGLGFLSTDRISNAVVAGNTIYYVKDAGSAIYAVHLTRYSSTPPTSEEQIVLQKRGPQFPIEFEKVYDGDSRLEGYPNVDLVRQKEIQFSYYYVYADNEVSVLAPYSKLCSASWVRENYRAVVTTVPSLETIPTNVLKIVFCFRLGSKGTFYEFGKITRSSPGGSWTGQYQSANQLLFLNNSIGSIVPSRYERNFEPYPKSAKTLTLLRDRLWAGNFIDGYDNNGTPQVELTPIGSYYVATANGNEEYFYTKGYDSIVKQTWVNGVNTINETYGDDPYINDGYRFIETESFNVGNFAVNVDASTELPYFMESKLFLEGGVSPLSDSAYSFQSFLGLSGGGSVTIKINYTYTDGTNSFVSSDTFNANGSPFSTGNVAIPTPTKDVNKITVFAAKTGTTTGTLNLSMAVYSLTPIISESFIYPINTGLPSWPNFSGTYYQKNTQKSSWLLRYPVLRTTYSEIDPGGSLTSWNLSGSNPTATFVTDRETTQLVINTRNLVGSTIRLSWAFSHTSSNAQTWQYKLSYYNNGVAVEEGSYTNYFVSTVFDTTFSFTKTITENVNQIVIRINADASFTNPTTATFKNLKIRVLSNDFSLEKSLGTNSSYNVGIVFKDGYGYSGSVVPIGSVDVPYKIGTTPLDSSKIHWRITDEDAGIPSWARYYSIVMTKDLKKTWFVNYQTLDIRYVYDNASGVETTTLTYDKANKYLRIDISSLLTAGLGYEFVDGDRIILRDPDGVEAQFDLPIIGFEDGQYIYCENVDITDDGTLSANKVARFEIYRPAKTNLDNLYYELGEHTYAICVDPNNSANMCYSVTEGIIDGDCVNVFRPDVYYSSGVIDTNSDDKVFRAMSALRADDTNIWNTSHSKPFVETVVGQATKSNHFKASNAFITGTLINGLHEWEGSDSEGFVPLEAGVIRKLQPTSRIQADGDVLLAICTNDTASVYVGETQMTQDGRSQVSILSNKLIGDVRMQKRGFGTMNPESVMEYNGYVYWFDIINRAYVRYSTNGIFPISEYKVVDYFEDQSLLNTASTDYCVSGYDPFYKMVFVTFSNAATTPQKTIGYSELKERWISYYDFAPRQYFNIKEAMYSVVAGTIYRHNSTTYNTFYSTQYDGEVTASFNDNAAVPKYWNTVKVQISPNLMSFSGGEQQIASSALYALFTNDRGQSTDITSARFDCDEYIAYGALLFDANSPGGLLNGDEMLSNTLQVKIRLTTQLAAHLKFISMGFNVSAGHQI